MQALRKPLALVGLILGIALLVLQFALTVPAAMSAGRSLPSAVVFYFSFFTILTNLLLALIYLGATIKGQRWLALFRHPATRASAAASIALVGGFYHLVLAALWQPTGLFALADIGLHYVAPALYLVWFAFWNRSGTLRYTDIPRLIAYPLAYLAYVMARGLFTGEYPYPVLDAVALGYPQVGLNILGLLVVMLVLASIAIAIDKAVLLGNPRR